jgi:endo-1,4-beta-D-glucanase Y
MVSTSGAGSGERIVDPASSSQTTSEGIAYGMLITVYMADKTHFDKIWTYAQSHFSRGLMSWNIDPSGNPVGNGGVNSASDADQDMAWSLIMADKQWPGGTYLNDAKTLLGNIKSQEISSSNTVNDGNFNNAGSSHPDYAAPDYYKVFATVSGDSSWSAVTTGEYTQLSGAQNATTGLIPDSIGGTMFGFDACRAPWRVGLDYCWNASSQAQSFLTKLNAYFLQTSANGATPSNIKIPVATSGGTGMYNSGAITGPAAVGAMASSANQALVDSSWNYLNSLVAGSTSAGSLNYFSSTVGLIAILSLSGNFIDYTAAH